MSQRDLRAEYAELTRQLLEITAKRNALGEEIERELKAPEVKRAAAEEKAVVAALIAVCSGRSTPLAQAEKMGIPTTRLDQLFFNLLTRINRQYPEYANVTPRRIGPRTIARWKEWEPAVRKYQSEL